MKPSTSPFRGPRGVVPPLVIEHLTGDAGWRLLRYPAGPARTGGRTLAHVTRPAGGYPVRSPRRSGRDGRSEPGRLLQAPRSSPMGTCCTRGSLLRRQPAHQRAELRADLLDLLSLLGLAALEEGGLAAVELLDQLAGEGAVLDLAEDLAHLLAGGLVDQPRAAGVAAELGGIRHRPVHLGNAALVHEVHDQLHLVQALEVRGLRLVAGLDEGGEPGLDQLGDAAAEHDLLAEQVSLGLLGEGGLEHP